MVVEGVAEAIQAYWCHLSRLRHMQHGQGKQKQSQKKSCFVGTTRFQASKALLTILGEFEHCNYSNVTPIWVEFDHSRIGAILFLLGLCSQPITWWLACQIIWGKGLFC